MKSYSLKHLADQALDRDFHEVDGRDRLTTAELLAHVAEFDERARWAPAGYSSMYAYCVEKMSWSEDVTSKRIQAARTAYRFPEIFPALADGRLHLSGVCLLAPYLSEGHAGLLKEAERKTKAEIERLIARRFPRTEMLAMVERVPVQHAPGHVAGPEPSPAPTGSEHAPGHVARSNIAPIAAERFALHVSIGQSTRDKLQYAQELLSHQVAAGDMAEVLDRALDALIRQLEKSKFAATDRPRSCRSEAKPGPRQIPADVQRAVWGRDGGQCTFVGESGHRCEARDLVEFDHIEPVALGGLATAENLRLRCRAHNQYEAERVFGASFMEQKRCAAAESRAANRAHARAAAGAASVRVGEQDVIPWLRQLGFRVDEARRAAAHCESIPDAPLEQRVRAALSYLQPKCRTVRASVKV